MSTATYRFGRFELRPATRELLADGQPATLGARAFDVLNALIERHEQLVTKDELLALVWPGRVVEENNLQVHVSALRKILGPNAITTVPGRGYQFGLKLDSANPSPVSWQSAKPSPPTTAEMPSIAVLPFINISDDPANEYFADGLSEQLISVLSKIRGLRVVARSSSFTFKGKAVTVAAVGDALNVATVLEGSVRKSGSLIRISVQLVHAGTDTHLWSETYDRTLEDIFAVQDDIARSVLMELRPTLLGPASDPKTGTELTAEVAAAVRGRSTDPEAYRLFLQARYFIDRLTREDTAKGIECLKEALAREAEFALAWTEVGRAYANEADWGWAVADDGYRRAREAVERALVLEPDLAEAHAAMAWIRLARDWDFDSTEASCRRALELMPGNASALQTASRLALFMGRHEEAVVLGHRAVEQDPLGAVAHYIFAATLWESGRFAEAVATLRLSLALAPQINHARALLSYCLNSLGRADEAWAEALQEPTEAGRLWALAIIHHSAGRRAESDQALGELSKKHAEACSSQIAEVHALREENDLAFAWLEQARARRDPGVLSTRINPRLTSLHTDPRWGPFLHEMGLAD